MSPVAQRRIHWGLACVVAIALAAAIVQFTLLHGRASGSPLVRESSALAGILVTLAAAVLAGFAFLLRPETGSRGALKRTSVAWSITLLAALIGLWLIAWTRGSLQEAQGALLLDDTQTAAYLDANGLADQQMYPRIPTGVELLSVEFTSSNDVHATGYVWQKYDHSLPDTVQRGVILPEGANAYDQKLAWQDDYGEYDVIGWYFDTIFRQRFDYRDYPFDRQAFWIRVWPLEAAVPLVLTPDFPSYAPWSTDAVQGIDPLFVFGGWNPIYSAFSMQINNYGVTFGSDEPEPLTPDLYFNLVMKRSFLSPLIKHLPFMLVISALLFATLLMTSRDEGRKGRFGLTTAGVVGASGALVLTVILEHNTIRGIVGSQQLSYIEALPLTLYVMIGLVTVNAMLVDAKVDAPFITWEDNFLPVVIYWPLLLSILVLATWIALF